MGRRAIADTTSPEFGRLFTDIRRSWFRLETLQHYDAISEREEFAAFRHGQALDMTPGPWQEMLVEHVAAGRQLARVHVIEEPHTEYIKYELAGYPRNVDAGEDVRVIPVQRGQWPPGVPRHDYWLFDDRDLWLMHYNSTGTFVAAEPIDDPETVNQHRRWRDLALDQSIALTEYSAHAPVS